MYMMITNVIVCQENSEIFVYCCLMTSLIKIPIQTERVILTFMCQNVSHGTIL